MRVVVWLDVNFNQETLRTVLFELAILAMPGPQSDQWTTLEKNALQHKHVSGVISNRCVLKLVEFQYHHVDCQEPTDHWDCMEFFGSSCFRFFRTDGSSCFKQFGHTKKHRPLLGVCMSFTRGWPLDGSMASLNKYNGVYYQAYELYHILLHHAHFWLVNTSKCYIHTWCSIKLVHHCCERWQGWPPKYPKLRWRCSPPPLRIVLGP